MPSVRSARISDNGSNAWKPGQMRLETHVGYEVLLSAKLARRGVIQGGQRVVVISTAHGLKFSEFKIGYHEGMLADVVARHRNPPVELPADAKTVKADIERWLTA